MREKTSVAQLDSADAKSGAHARSRRRRRKTRKFEAHKTWRPGRNQTDPSLTLGNVIHFIIAVFFLWPIFVFIAVIWSLTDAVNFIRYTVEACISSAFWFGRLCKEWSGGTFLHRNSPTMLRLRGQRKAFGVEARKDWREAGMALLGVGRAWSKTFGLGGLFSSLEKRIDQANHDWRRYVAAPAYDNSEAPAAFPEQYEVVDELPRGGSSARVYVVRKKDDHNGALQVLKYFDLRAGGNLESVVRESQAAQLAQKLGLITESELGNSAFWYVMPYYQGETLTGGVMRNFKHSRETGTVNDHYRISLGYVHQLLQIIAQYHEAGVFHKDIKPDNLIINGERIYLVDIGLMTPLSSMAQLTTHGTEYFRDPEMVKLALEGREVREVDAAKFDVYSIGAVLFFTLSGEFPTSGALSRLPREVPMGAQWVVNRAMTGMNQRYADARAMLTDIDYLCWAASQGTLEEVKPADLPSFKGMPVPLHLQGADAPPANTEYRQRLENAPGGYGAWYSAPAYYAGSRRGGGVRSAILTLLVLGALAFLALVFVGSAGYLSIAREPSMPQVQTNQDEPLSSRLPSHASHLAPVYEQIDASLGDGVDTETQVFADATPHIEFAPKLVKGVQDANNRWYNEIRNDLRQQGVKNPNELFEKPRVLFVRKYVREDASDEGGIAREYMLESARQGLQPAVYDDEVVTKIRRLLTDVSDKLALHRELAAYFASIGEVPPLVVEIHMEWFQDDFQVSTRTIFPGREQRAVYTLP